MPHRSTTQKHSSSQLRRYSYVSAFQKSKQLVRTVARLKAELAKLIATFEMAPDGLITVDSAGLIKFANKQAYKLFRWDPGELIGRPIEELIPARFRNRHVHHRKQYNTDPHSRAMGAGMELRGMHKDGSEFPVEIALSPIQIDHELIVTAIIRDITERKLAEQTLREAQLALQLAYKEQEHRVLERTAELQQANNSLSREIAERKQVEEALRYSEERLKQTTEVNDIGTWDWHLQKNELNWDAKCKALFGLTPEESMSYDAFVYTLHPNDRAGTIEAIKKSIDDKTDFNVEYRTIWPDGSTHWIMAKARVLADESQTPIRMIGIAMDITEDKKIKKDLEDARLAAERQTAELQSFITSMADGMAAWDAEGNLIFINDIGRQIMGMPRDTPDKELQGNYELRYLDGSLIPKDQWSSSRALRGDYIESARLITTTPWKTAVVSYSAAPIRDSSGRIIGATSVFRDISKDAELERQREELYEREHHIAQFLQSALVPPLTLIEIEGCKAALKYEPALREAEVGGDFYDVFELSDGRAGIVIGDVAGKGLAAAAHVAAAKHAIRSYAYLFSDTAEVMTLVNEALCKTPLDEQLSTNMLTAFFAVIDPKEGAIYYTNAGHEPPVIRHADGSIEELDAGAGVVLGIVPGSKYSQATRKLDPADTIVMVTDGITEARPSSLILFGKEGIVKYLSDHKDTSFQDIPSGLLEAARDFGNGLLQDDAAIVAIQCDLGYKEDI